MNYTASYKLSHDWAKIFEFLIFFVLQQDNKTQTKTSRCSFPGKAWKFPPHNEKEATAIFSMSENNYQPRIVVQT